MGPEPRPRSSTRHKRGTFRVIAILTTVWLVLAGALPGGSLGAKPGGGSTGGACALVPHLHELSIGQGLPYPVLVRGKEILARAYLSRPQCSDGDDIIDITAATLTMTATGATLASVAPTPAIGTTFPQIAPYSSAPAQDHTGDPKFVIGAAATQIASADRYTATFSLKIDYRARTASTATPVAGSATFPLPSGSALTATVEKKTAALRVLVQPLGDITQTYSTWFTDADRTTMQNAMTTLSRIFPVPDGTGDLSGTTGGVRYDINPALLDIRSVLGADGKWCGTGSNWAAIKAILAQHLQSWNTANPGKTADVIVGAVSSTKSGSGADGCAEAMSIPGSPQMWVRSIPDARRAPSISGGLVVMEMAHYLGIVPETRDAFGDAFHSPYTAADGTNPNRGYNVFGRSYLADDRSVMLLTGTGWHNTTTLLERDDFAAVLCRLGGATTSDCGVSGTVGTTTGVGAGPRFVMSGHTDGTPDGTFVVESYFTNDVAPTQPAPESGYRLLQFQGSTLLTDQGVPVIFSESEHHGGTDTAPAGTGIFAISLPFNTAANHIQLVRDGVVLYERNSPGAPQVTTTTRLQNGEIVNYTDDDTRNDTDPAITNDGKWVAWEAPANDSTVVHVAPASDVGQALTLGPPGDPIASTDPAWCGDGSQLAYVAGDDIYTISVDTRGPGIDFGTPFLLYDADEIEGGGLPAGTNPTWSPDCSQLAFEASSDIWKIDADGTGRTALTTDDRSHAPTWSQTAGDDRIAYQREVFAGPVILMNDEIVLASHAGTGTQFTVTTALDENDPGQACAGEADCSLREAINAANGNTAGSKDSIHFALTGTAPFTIQPTSPLPIISQPLVIDGDTQGTRLAGDPPFIQLSGTSAGAGAEGLTINAGDSLVRGLVINAFGGDGIQLLSRGNNIIEGSYIGTSADGTADAGNGGSGIWIGFITGGEAVVTNNLIGGTTAAARNVISGNAGAGVSAARASTVTVQGNYIGTNAAGTGAIANSVGVVLQESRTGLIGGTAAGAGNVISGNTNGGINLTSPDTNVSSSRVEGNRIGTNAAGTAAISNGHGVMVNQAPNNNIGGSASGAGNLISGNTFNGVYVLGDRSDSNLISGNVIGLAGDGDTALPNGIAGVTISSGASNQVGGPTEADRNVISGNGRDGVVVGGTTATNNVVTGNYIGTDAGGTLDRGNGGYGVFISEAPNNVVGGTEAGAGNLISGNNVGVVVAEPVSTGNGIHGNLIGTNAAGTADLGNSQSGVALLGAVSTLVGGTGPGAGNVISGNDLHGVVLSVNALGDSATTNIIQGNLIGTDITGSLDLGNTASGVHIDRAGSNVVGGATADARNVIAGNATGVAIVDTGSGSASGNVVEGNLIGVAADGSTARGNDSYGVFINNAPGGVAPFPPGNRIGGTASGAGNVIAANGTGVRITGISSSDNILYGNFIGVLADGTTARGNTASGVLIDDGGQRSIVGGIDAGEPNVIANNGGDGVQVGVPGEGSPSYGNLIQGNSIHTNGALGIDLVAVTDAASGGVTPNDALDEDVDGGNELMNFPEITSATFDGTETDIVGVLDSEPALANVVIDAYSSAACDGTGNGEGQTYLGTTTIPALDGTTGHGEWSLSVPGDHTGEFVTATATDSFPNTSEFSACDEVVAGPSEAASFVVNTTDDNVDTFGCGTIHCSLREAIERANDELNGEGPDQISFDIPGAATPAAPHVIAVDSALPSIGEAVVIDASSEPDFSTTTDAPVVQLDGSAATTDPTHGLVLATGASTIRSLSITNFLGSGVMIESDGNTLEGNYIGVEPDGVTAAPNGAGFPGGYGVMIDEASSNAIGLADGIETLETNRNIISGNDGPGVIITGATSTGNSIENNYIGTNAAGTAAVPNGVNGVVVQFAEGNSVGGVNPGTGNVISGNAGDGVTITGDATSGGANFVQLNKIGTNAAGTAALPNDGTLPTDGRGILIVNASDNTIGGANLVTGAGVGNLISGNATDGVEIQELVAGLVTANYLTNNRIGADSAGTGTIPNGGAGVEILGGNGTVIGGLTAGAGNVISGNTGDGVSIAAGTGHEVVGNSLDGNGGLGIDLAPDGVTANDVGDTDADTGPNNLQNFPVIESASSDGTTTTISGYVEDVPVGAYDVHLYASPGCDTSGNGEGALYLGTTQASSDAPGDLDFTFASDLPAEGDEITATATDSAGNTSEFSACAAVVGEADLSVTKTDSPDPVTAGNDLTYTVTVSNPSGPSDATNVVVTDVLPDDVTFDAVDSDSRCTESAGTVTCTIASISPDASDSVDIVVVPQRSATLNNTASVEADQVDPNLTDNSDTETTNVNAADWEIYTLDPAAPSTSQQLLVSNGTRPSWGTDNQVAFARSSGIWLVSGEGSGAMQVAGTGGLDSSPTLGGRVLGFQRHIPFEIEGGQADIMLVREAELITVTAEVAQPDNARFDIFFDCGGPFFPMAVGLLPDSVTATTATASYTYDSSLSCGSGTPTISAVVSDGVFRSDEGAAAAQTEVNADPKPPVVAIYNPIDGETLLQFDPIAAHGWGKDPEDGQLADSRLSWTLTGPGGLSLSRSGHAVDFQPPATGWTPSAMVGGVPQDDYLIVLTGTDSSGMSYSRSNAFAILADADRDNLHAGIDVTGCGGTAASADADASNAFADPDGDGIPSSDDRFTDGGLCTAETDFSALINFDPDEFNIPATGQVATVSIRVPYKSMSQVDGGSVRITEIGGIAANITQIPRGWSVKDGVGVAKFDRITLANFFERHGMVGNRIAIVVEGSSKSGVNPPWSFEGVDSTMVKFGN